jgi:hypothetical protein
VSRPHVMATLRMARMQELVTDAWVINYAGDARVMREHGIMRAMACDLGRAL